MKESALPQPRERWARRCVDSTCIGPFSSQTPRLKEDESRGWRGCDRRETHQKQVSLGFPAVGSGREAQRERSAGRGRVKMFSTVARLARSKHRTPSYTCISDKRWTITEDNYVPNASRGMPVLTEGRHIVYPNSEFEGASCIFIRSVWQLESPPNVCHA